MIACLRITPSGDARIVSDGRKVNVLATWTVSAFARLKQSHAACAAREQLLRTLRDLAVPFACGFREFQAARRTIQGYEAVHRSGRGKFDGWQEMILARQVQFIDSLFDLAA
jgi:hypothetical protein